MTYFGWEMELLRMIQELHTQLLTPVLISLSWINNHGEFWILTGLILTVIPKTRKCGISVLLAMLFGTLITDLTLKGICARPRPYYYTEYMDGNHIRLLIEMKERELLRSFPSGHSVCSGGIHPFLLQKSGDRSIDTCLFDCFFQALSVCTFSYRCTCRNLYRSIVCGFFLYADRQIVCRKERNKTVDERINSGGYS